MLLGEPKTMDTIRERKSLQKAFLWFTGYHRIHGKFTEKNYRWISFQL